MKVERLRIRYRLTQPACEMNNRDQLSAWEAALKEAGLVIAYSEGKRPTAQMSVATLLPLGVTSDCELLDVFLAERREPREAHEDLRRALPEGIEVLSVEEVGVNAPSLQSLVTWAEFEAVVPADGVTLAEVEARIERFLAAESWPAEYRREMKVREYDLRPLVGSLAVASGQEGALILKMRLRAGQENTARADQVLLALELPPAMRIHRRRLDIEQIQPGVLAYRRAGEWDEG